MRLEVQGRRKTLLRRVAEQPCDARCLTAEGMQARDQVLRWQGIPPTKVEGGDAMREEVMPGYSCD